MTSLTLLALCLTLGSLFHKSLQIEGNLPLVLGGMDFPQGFYGEEFRIRKIIPSKARKVVGSYRLPRSVIPLHYMLEIRPVIDRLENDTALVHTAPGKVDIHIKCEDATSSITLHSKHLKIYHSQVEIQNATNQSIPVKVTGYNYDEEKTHYTIFLDRDTSDEGEYILTIPFVAAVRSDIMSGLYRTVYYAPDGTRKSAAVTQFQKDDASRAFPCFDEPAMKAEFTIKLGRLKTHQSFSNMEQVGEPEPIPDLPDWVWDNYARLVAMPVYTIAFAVVSDFVAVESPASRVQIKTWVPKSMLTKTSVTFSSEFSPKILKFFEELFDIPYPLKKLDNLAVPQMNLYAMENIGLVTYRPIFLVFDPKENTQWDKYLQASYIAHEFVHMWFGNVVTPVFWNDFFLSEGFARYYQFIGASVAGDEFRSTDRWTVDVVQWAMEFDEGANTVPLRPNEVDRVYYAPFHIEYEKGAALIRMMQSFLTQKTFIAGLRRYLKRYLYRNTVQDNLFDAMNEQALDDGHKLPLRVGDIMKPWTAKTGFPVIHVTRGDSNRLFLTQQRFIIHPSATTKMESGLWHVPIWYITQSHPTYDENNTTPNLWIDNITLSAYIPVNTTSEWIIVNPDARGYYRVIYDSYLTSLIVDQLERNHTVFSFHTRSQLIDDHWRSARARYINVQQALDLTWYLDKEEDQIVWTSVFNNFAKLYSRLIDTPLVRLFKKYILRMIKPPIQRLGITPPTSGASKIMLNAMFLDWLCSMEDEECTKLTTTYFEKWMSDPKLKNPIPTDVQSQMYCAAVATMNTTIRDFLLKHYQTTRSPRQKSLIVRSMTCFQNKEYLTELLENTINRDYTHINVSQHGHVLINNIVRNRLGREIAWNFIKSRHADITEVLGPMTIPNVIDAVSPYASNRGLSNLNYEIMTFIALYLQLPGLSDSARNSLTLSAQRIVENSLWMDFFYDDIAEWLKHKLP